MRLGIMMIAGLLIAAGATAGHAGEVNCKFVMKNLSLPGRTVQSVAETMSISEDDVKKCQEQQAQGGDADKKGGGEQKPAGEAK